MQTYFSAKELFHTNDSSTAEVLSPAARRSSTLHPWNMSSLFAQASTDRCKIEVNKINIKGKPCVILSWNIYNIFLVACFKGWTVCFVL